MHTYKMYRKIFLKTPKIQLTFRLEVDIKTMLTRKRRFCEEICKKCQKVLKNLLTNRRIRVSIIKHVEKRAFVS